MTEADNTYSVDSKALLKLGIQFLLLLQTINGDNVANQYFFEYTTFELDALQHRVFVTISNKVS